MTEPADLAPALDLTAITALDSGWWLNRAAHAMRRTHYRILANHDPLPELLLLRERVDWLLSLAERASDQR